jgi:hypothetical protein
MARGFGFFVENMPDNDLKPLSAAFLIENLNLACDSWEKCAVARTGLERIVSE